MLTQKSSALSAPQGRVALLTAGLAAILASTCCVGPLLLLLLGFSGAWIGNLTLLEPLRPWFIVAAVVSLAFAWRRIWRPLVQCAPGEVCALPVIRTGYQWLFALIVMLVLLALAFPYIAPWFY